VGVVRVVVSLGVQGSSAIPGRHNQTVLAGLATDGVVAPAEVAPTPEPVTAVATTRALRTTDRIHRMGNPTSGARPEPGRGATRDRVQNEVLAQGDGVDRPGTWDEESVRGDRFGTSRLEAFSDFSALGHRLPALLVYILSFAFVGIY
jgi:hypothetical protein